MSKEETVEVATKPIPTDGYKSRRYVAGCSAFLLVLIFVAAAYLWRGFSEQYTFYLVAGDLAFLLLVLGVMSVKDVLEVVKLKYLGAKG